MNDVKASSGIEYEISKISRTHNPAQDRTFVMGMIELAEFAELIDTPTANRYRDALDAKFIERNQELKRTAGH
ncbi:hypothetical protein SAMN05660489_04358 [Pseudomonas sp. LAMO17WK12:I10]|uniref:hypothetical protein n=1 Tax=unclassified Pseudomonas TaxID=196821 RepID=UPI000BC43BBC|nr:MULTISPECIES: hypothetical protein [unclassified Pseudomonas]PXX60717.1 hypothetical protein H160_04393 [Pseudomonas sp. LAMO17WK12:I9]SNY45411.1 hypothetical protein SAMN05660489_04358 [Pseudomonas sp. LAMO17WK12:I10]